MRALKPDIWVRDVLDQAHWSRIPKSPFSFNASNSSTAIVASRYPTSVLSRLDMTNVDRVIEQQRKEEYIIWTERIRSEMDVVTKADNPNFKGKENF